jgi:hypothetical protein
MSDAEHGAESESASEGFEEPAHVRVRLRFDELYFDWLQARARCEEPHNGDEGMSTRSDAVDEAARRLLSMPAIISWMVWRKWEVLDVILQDDVLSGKHIENRTVAALGQIKADVMRLMGEGL